MRIRSFHIDAFGTLRDVTVEGLPEAGAVFLGHMRLANPRCWIFSVPRWLAIPAPVTPANAGILWGNPGCSAAA